MEHAELIDAVQARIATLDEQRGALVTFLEALQETDGGAPMRTPAPTRKPKAAKAGRRARPTKAGDENSPRGQILALLTKTSPMSLGELATAVQMKPPAAYYHLRKLVAESVVMAIGRGSAATYSVA